MIASFNVLKHLLAKHSGLCLDDDKRYLVESGLARWRDADTWIDGLVRRLE